MRRTAVDRLSSSRDLDRLTVPVPPPSAVRRDRLLGLLDVAVSQRLTLVVAPPGYGKTVLLSQWAREQRRYRVCWLTVRPTDDDPRTFARDLLSALGVTQRRHGTDVDPLVDPAGTTMGEAFVTTLLGQLEAMPPTTIVLDDFHQMGNRSLLEEIGTIIDRSPRSIHFVLATRVDPIPSYYRWRVADALVELRQHDLSFTRDEASVLVERLAGHTLDDAAMDTLVEKTEAWAVGLQLAALSLRERADAGEFLQALSDAQRHVADYLTEEVLHRQPGPDRRFLLATSVLDTMNGSLCEHVTGVPGAQAMLERLDTTSLFTTRLDARPGWFRYHDLFRDLLRHHLRDEDPAIEPLLLRRAAEWYLRHGDLEAAVAHLIRAGAWEDVLDAASTHGPALLKSGDASLVARWVEQVPTALRHRRPVTVLQEAAGWAVAGDALRADVALTHLDDHRTTSPGDAAVANLLRAYVALQRGPLNRAMRHADEVLDGLETLGGAPVPNVLGLTVDRADLAAGAQVVRGIALLYDGHFSEARWSLEVAALAGHALWQASALSALALVEACAGQLVTAEHLGRRCLSLTEQLDMDHYGITAEAHLALAHVALERDLLSEATLRLDEAHQRARLSRRTPLIAWVAAEEALLAMRLGEVEDGLVVLTARRSGEHPGHPSLPGAVRARHRAALAQLLMAKGNLDGAERALGTASELDATEVVAARTRLAVEQDDLAEAHRCIAGWPQGTHLRSTLERELWLAVLAHREGDAAGAQARLASVVEGAEVQGDVGLFRSAGAHVLPPARALYRTTPTPFLRMIVEAPLHTLPSSRTTELIEPLTERELRVLAMLPRRFSNSEMASQLGVSLNTLKTHLKHIYRKLGVQRRAEAVEVSERMHLL